MLAMGIGWAGGMFWTPGRPKIIPSLPKVTPPQLADQPQPGETTPDLVRSPTTYEEVVFQAAVQHRRQVRGNLLPQPLVLALNHVLNEPETDMAKLCEPLIARRTAYENSILSNLGSWNRAEQHAALKILRKIGSPRAVPVLDRLSRDPEFAKIAWPVALQLAPAKLLGRWARTDTPAHRKEAIQRLLSRREDAEAIGEFLKLVAQPDSRTLAIEVIKAEKNPPVEALFASLDGGTREERHTAGLVLGRIATPDITRQLLALATQNSFPPEVMIGLLNSSDQQAARFLNQAKRNPQAQAAVQLACLEWEMISYTSMLPEPLEIH
jgi:HEAT repeat protein